MRICRPVGNDIPFASILLANALVHSHLLCIAFCLPGSDLLPERLFLSDAPIHPVLTQYRQVTLGHVEPTAVFGRGMDLDLLADASGFLWLKRLVERGEIMRVQIIQHQHDVLDLWGMHLTKAVQHVGKILVGAVCAHRHLSPATQSERPVCACGCLLRMAVR